MPESCDQSGPCPAEGIAKRTLRSDTFRGRGECSALWLTLLSRMERGGEFKLCPGDAMRGLSAAEHRHWGVFPDVFRSGDKDSFPLQQPLNLAALRARELAGAEVRAASQTSIACFERESALFARRFARGVEIDEVGAEGAAEGEGIRPCPGPCRAL